MRVGWSPPSHPVIKLTVANGSTKQRVTSVKTDEECKRRRGGSVKRRAYAYSTVTVFARFRG